MKGTFTPPFELQTPCVFAVQRDQDSINTGSSYAGQWRWQDINSVLRSSAPLYSYFVF